MKEWNLQKNYWLPMIIQTALFVIYFLVRPGLLSHEPGIGGSDEPGYALFDFSSLRAIFSQLRTFGLPLVLKFYNLFFKDFRFWPHFSMLLYVLSILYLYRAFIKFGLDKVLSFIVVTILLWDKTSYGSFCEIMTEPLAASFLHLTIGTLLLAVLRDNWKTYAALGALTFFLCQVRASISYVAVLIPFWAAGAMILIKKCDFPFVRKRFFYFAAASILPLISLCLVRMFVMGQFGLVSSAGGYLSGHATHYLNENNIKLLSGDSRLIAEDILKRKQQLNFSDGDSHFSGRTAPGQTTIKIEALRFNYDVIISWLAAVKYRAGQEPFNDMRKNVEPWKYVRTLADFFARHYDVQVDRLLMKYSKDILKIEWKRYLRWILGGSLYGMLIYGKDRVCWALFFILLGILSTQYLLRAGPLEKSKRNNWQRGVIFIGMIGVSFFVLGYLSVIIMNTTAAHLLNFLVIYFLPANTLLLLPPFWLKKGK